MQPAPNTQPTFADLAIQQRGCSNRLLEVIAEQIDFSEAERQIMATHKEAGRPAYPVRVLLRVMLLQHLYGLSDPQAEAQLKDRLSFQKFALIGAHDAVPDETTICRFRQRMIQCGLQETLLQMLNERLETRGYIVKRTTLVDATLLESTRKRPDPEMVRQGTAPDAEASYSYKAGRYYYGYKAHISSDGQHQLIRRAVLTSAGAQEAHLFEKIAPEDTSEIYGDKAYDTKATQAWLRQRNIASGIQKKGAHHIKLTDEDRRENYRKRRARAQIERIFAHLKTWQCYRRVRYLGLIRNQLELTLKAVVYNLKRIARISGAMT
jgi:IS5 family transposase